MGDTDRGDTQPSLLVVEDEVDLAAVYEHWLADDYDVTVANDGQTALDLLDESIDVVLLDRLMPGMTGDEVLEHIREDDLDCRVAMVTAVEPDFDIVAMGFDAYLTKPLSREDLHGTVEQLLTRSRYTDQVLEYASLVEKRATLLSRKSDHEIGESDEFANLERRIEEIEAELDEDAGVLTDDMSFVAMVRDVAGPSSSS